MCSGFMHGGVSGGEGRFLWWWVVMVGGVCGPAGRTPVVPGGCCNSVGI
jgi:hypothetical protein